MGKKEMSHPGDPKDLGAASWGWGGEGGRFLLARPPPGPTAASACPPSQLVAPLPRRLALCGPGPPSAGYHHLPLDNTACF